MFATTGTVLLGMLLLLWLGWLGPWGPWIGLFSAGSATTQLLPIGSGWERRPPPMGPEADAIGVCHPKYVGRLQRRRILVVHASMFCLQSIIAHLCLFQVTGSAMGQAGASPKHTQGLGLLHSTCGKGAELRRYFFILVVSIDTPTAANSLGIVLWESGRHSRKAPKCGFVSEKFSKKIN